ncbi:MAG: hypothetical protein ACP5HD_08635 [Thermoproteus sp.]
MRQHGTAVLALGYFKAPGGQHHVGSLAERKGVSVYISNQNLTVLWRPTSRKRDGVGIPPLLLLLFRF